MSYNIVQIENSEPAATGDRYLLPFIFPCLVKHLSNADSASSFPYNATSNPYENFDFFVVTANEALVDRLSFM